MEARNVDDDGGGQAWEVRMREGEMSIDVRCASSMRKENFAGCQKVVRRFSDQHVIQQDRSKLA